MLYGHLNEGFVDPQRQEKDTGEGGGVSEVMLGKGSFRLREEPEVQKLAARKPSRSGRRPVRLQWHQPQSRMKL